MSQYIPTNVRKSLKDIIMLLNKSKIKHLVLGAIPVQYYGRPRVSWDADVLIVGISKEELFNLLPSQRYQLVRGEMFTFKFKDLETNSFLDIIIEPREVGLTRESFKRRKIVQLDGANINLPSPEDYIITKLKARRPYTEDFGDLISTLENMYERLDMKYLMEKAKAIKQLHLLQYYLEHIKRVVK